jgi:collagenase-like PrtC family protease
MKFSIWFNNDSTLINKINLFCNKHNINKLDIEFFCGFPLYKSSLNRFYNEKIIKNDFELSIIDIQKKGFVINYLMNSKIIDFKLIENELKWLDKLWIEFITVSNIDLINFINKIYPQFKIIVSIKSKLDIYKLNKYKNISRIIFHQSVNHNFKQLIALVKLCKNKWIETEILANELCYSDCELRDEHYLQISKYNWISCEFFDKIWDFCIEERKEISIINNSPWVRLEDVILYKKIGINYIKLAWRNFDSDLLENCIKYYLLWIYEWNFFNLMDLDWKKWWWRYEKRKLSNRKLDWVLYNKFLKNLKWKD